MNFEYVTLGLNSKYIPYVNESKRILQVNNANWPFIALILYILHHKIWSEQVKWSIGHVVRAVEALGPWCVLAHQHHGAFAWLLFSFFPIKQEDNRLSDPLNWNFLNSFCLLSQEQTPKSDGIKS